MPGKMNSSAIGRLFEKKVLDFFKREIANGRFLARPQDCKVIPSGKYYSKDREDDIVFDVAIEICRPGSTSFSVLILIECKHYSHAVPVDDAEEFAQKIQQVAGAKGIIVSTGSFQHGTITFCRSKRIGLVKCLPRKFDWILERGPLLGTQTSWPDVYRGLLSDSHGNYHPDLYGCVGDTYATSLDPLFRDLVSDVAEVESLLKPIEEPRYSPRRIVDFLSKEEIERRSAVVLEAVGYDSGQVPLDKICQWQLAEVGLSVQWEMSPDADDEWTDATLGRIRFDPLEITIFKRANAHPGRANFTLAHELGHHFLGHSKYIASEYCEEADLETDEPDDPASVGLADIRSMEWQANYFASCLILPRQALLADFYELAREFDLKNKGNGYIYLDDQPCNHHDFRRVTNRLMLKYEVTRSVVRIRLQALGLLTDARKKARTGDFPTLNSWMSFGRPHRG